MDATRLPFKATFCLIAALVLSAGGPASADARPQRIDVSLTIFHDSLAPHGEWVSTARFGRVWLPRVPLGWRPYTQGYWTYTDVGWTWVSDEPFGWATYHYGRWYFDEIFGWVWVPDTVWGPAWVAWRSGGEYVGWAPLPPDILVAEEFDPVIDPLAYTFVRTNYLVERRLVTYCEPPARNVTFVRLTANETHFALGGSVVINRGVRVETVERAIGHAVPRRTVQATETVGAPRVDASRVVVYRPATVTVAVGATVGRPAPPPARPVESLAAMEARHTREVHDLDLAQVKARAALEAKHTQELRKPPAGITLEQVKTRQDAEHKAQQDQEAREKQILAARHAREKNGGVIR
jgi:hypothetical protein